MADPPSPNQSRPGFERGASSGDLGHGPTSSRASVPPSEPKSSRASFEALDAQIDRPARLQMIVALILGLVLVAIPLYLWRRPRAESIAVSTGATDAGALPAVTAAPTPGVEDKLVVGEPKILSCHDPGPKKTPPEQCDHVVELEKAFAKAIEDSVSCVPRDAGGGSIIFVVDANFKKKSAGVSTPKEGRTLRSSKIAGACERAVKSKLGSLPYESMKHEHARYRVAITATYPKL
ncbi:MAG: hypothetical protein KF764_17335 [Labilithrix sp.]|nr:hypothetical protein [Labilithrix sp.]MBX3221853.1 hypothetical protein [Labilithrix sp.]